jgi:hypothetical protein
MHRIRLRDAMSFFPVNGKKPSRPAEYAILKTVAKMGRPARSSHESSLAAAKPEQSAAVGQFCCLRERGAEVKLPLIINR